MAKNYIYSFNNHYTFDSDTEAAEHIARTSGIVVNNICYNLERKKTVGKVDACAVLDAINVLESYLKSIEKESSKAVINGAKLRIEASVKNHNTLYGEEC